MTQILNFILLHGFGAAPAVFTELQAKLENCGATELWTLPGYPQSPWPSTTPFAQAQTMAETVPENSILIGWSLGGLHALQIAKYSQNVRAVILLAALPYFLREEQGRGLTEQGLTQLTERIRENTQQGLDYFWKLHSLGGAALRKQYNHLKTYLNAQETPNVRALTCGLEELEVDMRSTFKHLDIPVMGIIGENDILIHPNQALNQLNIKESTNYLIIKGAGHAFFLTHPENTAKAIEFFINKYFNFY